jgi:hypothetical protein
MLNALSHSNIAPIEVLSDGRRYKRFVREEAVRISFRGNTATGNLANLSATGLLAIFGSSSVLPAVAEEVAVHIEVDNRDDVLDLNGTVVRIQISDSYESKDIIEIAVDFRDVLPASRHGLRKLINYLLSKDRAYKP